MVSYGSVRSLLIALEMDGVIEGFMGAYLRNSQPNLKSAYGIMLSYWDGISNYILCLMMLSAFNWE